MLAIAHRTPLRPEDCAALAAGGASVFEIDVQALGGELVVSHFLPLTPWLPRVRRDRARLTVRRRARVEVALETAVAAVPAGAQVLLDLKVDTGPRAHALVERVVAAGLDPARCVVSTKGWDTLPALIAAGFRTWRTIGDAAALRAALALGPIPDSAVTVRHRLLDEHVVARLHAAGPAVMCWTVNDPARARTVLGFGVDGVTSDSAEVLRLVAAHPA